MSDNDTTETFEYRDVTEAHEIGLTEGAAAERDRIEREVIALRDAYVVNSLGAYDARKALDKVLDAIRSASPVAAVPVVVGQPEDKGLALSTEIWIDVATEREMAHRKHGRASMESWQPHSLMRLTILLEEVGEVAREFNEAMMGARDPDPVRLRAELIQVAAMAGAWADALSPFRLPSPVTED